MNRIFNKFHFYNVIYLIFIIIGLIIRLGGVLFYGTHDMDIWIYDWGSRVVESGLPAAYDGGGAYGIISYFLAGIAAKIALLIPRFWWLPHKIMEIIFEILTFILLYKILPFSKKKYALLFFWLNPWFILHSAYYGYWDPSFTFFGVLGIYILTKNYSINYSLPLLGVILTLSSLFKPQGTAFLIIPLSIFFMTKLVIEDNAAFLKFVIPFIIINLFIAIGLELVGGNIGAIAKGYGVTLYYMPNLSNNSINIWNTVTVLIQKATNQSGPVYSLALPPLINTIVHPFVSLVTLFIIIIFSMKIKLDEEKAKFPLNSLTRISGIIFLSLFFLFTIAGKDTTNQILKVVYKIPPYKPLLIILLVLGISLTFFFRQICDGVRFIVNKLIIIFKINPLDQQNVDPISSLTLAEKVLLIVAFASLVLPQFGTKYHENHDYAGMVLLIPIVVLSRGAIFAYIIMTMIHFYYILFYTKFCVASIWPVHASEYVNNKIAIELLRKIEIYIYNNPTDNIISMQSYLNNSLSKIDYLNQNFIFPTICFLQFLCACYIVNFFFKLVNNKKSTVSNTILIKHN